MKGDYPRFNDIYSREELIEHFLLSESERSLALEMRGEANQLGFGILLKSVLYLGYFPSRLRDVPNSVRAFIAEQLRISDSTTEYSWNSTRYNHTLATNNREDQEVKILSLQLLLNCMMLFNTVLIQKILQENPFLNSLTSADLRGLTPLFHGHINPYGLFYLDLHQPSFLEAA
ncbi:MAG TPA: DUF4158 domain-containing protein [Candidatus Obscuribacterales bacterium]